MVFFKHTIISQNPIAHPGVHSCFMLHGIGQMYNDIYTISIIIISEYFYCSKKSPVFCLFISPPLTPYLATTDLYCRHSFAFSRMSYSWNHTVCCLFTLTFHLVI